MKKIIIFVASLFFIAQTIDAQVQYLGSPTTTVRNRGNFVSDSLFYFPKRQKLPTDSGAGRYNIADSSLYLYTGYQWIKAINTTDTSSMLNAYLRGSGTTNYVPKFTGTRTLGSSQIFDNGTNVGIGTASPSAKLDVDGIARIIGSVGTPTTGEGIELQYISNQGEILTYNRTGSAYTPLRVRSSTIKLYGGAGSSGIDINASGNVGIGTTSPTTYSGYTTLAINNATNGGLIDLLNNGTRVGTLYNTSTEVALGSITSVPLRFYTNSSGRVTIASTGAVKFDAYGTGTFTGTPAYNLSVDASGNIIETAGSVISGSGTTNYIPKFTASTTLGNSAIYESSGNVGIGTTSPSYKLDVNGDAKIANAVRYFVGSTEYGVTFANAGAMGMESYQGTYLYFGTGSGATATERMRISSDGELLIGTTSDVGAYALQVAGSIYNTTGAVLAASSGNVGIGTTSPNVILELGIGSLSNTTQNQYFRVNSGKYNDLSYSHIDLFNYGNNFGNPLGWRITSGTESSGVTVGRFLSFNTVVTDGSGNPSTATERMRITSTGNVGIGTTNPATPLDVVAGSGAGAISIRGNSPNNIGDLYFFSNDGATLYSYLRGTSSDLQFIAQGSRNLIYTTNGNERMRITSGGYVGIGTSSVYGQLTIANITNNVGGLNFGEASDASSRRWQIRNDVTSFGDFAIRQSTTQTGTTFTDRLYINSSGELLLGTTTDAGAYPLQVAGNIFVKNGTNGFIVGPNSEVLVGEDASGVYIATGLGASNNIPLYIGSSSATNSQVSTVKSGGSYSWKIATTTAMTLNSSGDVGVGVTPNSYANKTTISLGNSSNGGTYEILRGSTKLVQLIGDTAKTELYSLTAVPLNIYTNGVQRMTIKADGEILMGTGVTDIGSYDLQVNADVLFGGSLTTGAPTGGGVRAWRLGEAAAVSPTSPNRTIRVEIDGTVYYIHAKTTND